MKNLYQNYARTRWDGSGGIFRKCAVLLLAVSLLPGTSAAGSEPVWAMPQTEVPPPPPGTPHPQNFRLVGRLRGGSSFRRKMGRLPWVLSQCVLFCKKSFFIRRGSLPVGLVFNVFFLLCLSVEGKFQ